MEIHNTGTQLNTKDRIHRYKTTLKTGVNQFTKHIFTAYMLTTYFFVLNLDIHFKKLYNIIFTIDYDGDNI